MFKTFTSSNTLDGQIKARLNSVSTLIRIIIMTLVSCRFDNPTKFDLKQTTNKKFDLIPIIYRYLKEAVYLPGMQFYLRQQFCSLGCNKPLSEYFTVLTPTSSCDGDIQLQRFQAWAYGILLTHLEADSWAYTINHHLCGRGENIV